MLNKESAKYSLKNIIHRKTRSFLTVLSIFIGITTIFIFISFGWGLYDYVNSFASSTSADKITIQPKGMGAPGLDDSFALTESDLRAVQKTPGVYDATGIYMGAVEIQKDKTKKYVFYGGLDPRKNILQEMNGLKIEQGRNLQKGEENKVVLGYNYLIEKKIFPKAIELNEKIFISGVEFRVVGFFSIMGNPQDDSNVYLTEEGVKKIYPNKTGYSMIIAKADKTQIENVVDNIEKALRKSRELEKGKEDFYVASFQELLNSYMSALNIIIGFVILIALISVLVSAINTANTMITSVLERVKEVGTMKAIGAKNSEIFAIFLFESSILGFVAGLIGIFFGFIITFVAKQILSNLGWSFLSPHYSPSLFIGCILFAVVTGAISGVAPAVNASRTNVVDALRYE